MGTLNNILSHLKQTPNWGNKIYCLVETGTYLGDSVAAALKEPAIGPIYSIELQERYYNASELRFLSERQVKILYGNSHSWISSIMTNRHKIYANPPKETNFIFWLDAHIDWGNYQENLTPKVNWCPLMDELTVIKEYYRPGDIIAIDDLRIIRKQDGWGSEVVYQQLIDMVASINPRFNTILLDSNDAKEDILLAF